MANLFNWWIKFKVVDRNKKNVGCGCNHINKGLEPKFFRNLCKEQKKKDLHLKNSQLPVFNAAVWKDKLFFTTLMFVTVFFVIFLKLQVGH